MTTTLSISETVKAAKAGEEAAWKLLYHQFHPSLYANALRLFGNTPPAKDAVQDAFLLAYLKLDQLKDPENFGGWIKKILLHNCYRKLHTNQHPQNIDNIPLENDNWWDNEVERKLELFSKRTQIFESLAHLAEPLRSTLLLRYFSAFQSYEQIATILSVPVGTVRSRLNQARSKLSDHWHKGVDTNENIYRRSEEWNKFYFHHLCGMYENESIRSKLVNHFDKKLEIIFTSGKLDTGRQYFEKEINDDLYFGSRYQPINIVSCGNISVVEGTNYNSPEYPDRCPLSSVFVLFRDQERVSKLNLYNSSQ